MHTAQPGTNHSAQLGVPQQSWQAAAAGSPDPGGSGTADAQHNPHGWAVASRRGKDSRSSGSSCSSSSKCRGTRIARGTI